MKRKTSADHNTLMRFCTLRRRQFPPALTVKNRQELSTVIKCIYTPALANTMTIKHSLNVFEVTGLVCD